MTDSKSKEAKFDETKDPLSEIRHRAQELWVENGKPAGTSWKDFVVAAEGELLSGISSGVPSGRTRDARKDETNPTSPAIFKLRSSCKDPFLRALASSFNDLLDEHESFCLAQLLLSYRFQLAGSEDEITPTIQTMPPIFTALVREYSSEGLAALGVNSPNDLSTEDKLHYWESKLTAWQDADRALSFADRNTMQRLHHSMLQSGLFGSIENRQLT